MTISADFIWPLPWAAFCVLLTGILKELWDQRYGSGFCFLDMTSNLLGIASAAIMAQLLPSVLFN